MHNVVCWSQSYDRTGQVPIILIDRGWDVGGGDYLSLVT